MSREKITAILQELPELAQQAADGSFRIKVEKDMDPRTKRLKGILAEMHEADVADLLEGLPFGERLLVWAALPKRDHGKVLLEVSAGVLEMLAAEIGDRDLAHSLKKQDVSDVAHILRLLPDAERARMMRLAELSEDADLRASLSFGKDTVGSIMDFRPVVFQEGMTIGQVASRLRKRGELPSHTDKLFITNARGRLTGVLPLKRVLISAKDAQVSDIIVAANVHSFRATDSIELVSSSFEKYDLVSAPVVNSLRQVIGRITIDEIVEYLEKQRTKGMMISTGISGDEDLFAPVSLRFRNRWIWLLVNMAAAAAVSRMVGFFEGTIEQLVALAALMPIIASLSGNAGIQTSTLIVRAIALKNVSRRNVALMMLNEMRLATLGGVVAGILAAGFGYLFYQSPALSMIIFISMVTAFVVSAIAGFLIPLLMDALGKDPALGTAVVLTVITDCASFFFFLGLGTLFLI